MNTTRERFWVDRIHLKNAATSKYDVEVTKHFDSEQVTLLKGALETIETVTNPKFTDDQIKIKINQICIEALQKVKS